MMLMGIITDVTAVINASINIARLLLRKCIQVAFCIYDLLDHHAFCSMISLDVTSDPGKGFHFAQVDMMPLACERLEMRHDILQERLMSAQPGRCTCGLLDGLLDRMQNHLAVWQELESAPWRRFILIDALKPCLDSH